MLHVLHQVGEIGDWESDVAVALVREAGNYQTGTNNSAVTMTLQCLTEPLQSSKLMSGTTTGQHNVKH